MKTAKTSLMVMATLLYVWSCTNQTNTEEKRDHSDAGSTTIAPGGLKLNSGEKWLVNEEMRPFIEEAERILNEFVDNKLTDYKTLASKLSEQNSGLIKSCTMKGESHDELHKWLLPHMDLIKSLDQEKDTDRAGTIVHDLRLSFDTYHQYFK
jgi:hypothetical protein